jgi:hypothetical protein
VSLEDVEKLVAKWRQFGSQEPLDVGPAFTGNVAFEVGKKVCLKCAAELEAALRAEGGPAIGILQPQSDQVILARPTVYPSDAATIRREAMGPLLLARDKLRKDDIRGSAYKSNQFWADLFALLDAVDALAAAPSLHKGSHDTWLKPMLKEMENESAALHKEGAGGAIAEIFQGVPTKILCDELARRALAASPAGRAEQATKEKT